MDDAAVVINERGKLSIGHDADTTATSGPSPAHVLACALESLSKTKKARDAWLDLLPTIYARAHALPEVAPELLTACDRLFDRLRDRRTITRRGEVRFTRDTPAD